MPISDLLASITGDSSSSSAALPNPLPQKRKAENDLRGVNDKVIRRDTPAANSSRPVLPIRRPSTQDLPTGRPRTTTVANTPSTVRQPLTSAGPRVPTVNRPSTTADPSKSPATTSSNALSKAPKKGSFAEIMARGKAATATMGQVGKIQHKRIEKHPSKVAKEEQRSGGKPTGTKSTNVKEVASTNRVQPAGRDAKSGSRDIAGKSKIVEPEKKVKKAALATTGYTGTARPVPGKPRASASSRYGGSANRDRGRGSSRLDEYESEGDEDDDEVDEEEEYYSDASSDMEAATFEVDEEEERAARIARKEDAEALAEENRMKREKEEKRKKLLAMAKARQR